MTVKKTTKKTTKPKMSKEELEELSNLSGEKASQSRKRVNCPIVRLAGDVGKFKMWHKDENDVGQTEEIGESIKLVFLKIRRSLVEFKSKTERFYTNEHTSWKDKIVLFHAIKGQKPLKIAEGTNEEIRAQYQGLRTNQVVYSLMDDKLVKLTIKGGSLSDWFEYLNSFGKDEHIFEYETVIGSAEEQSPAGKPYFKTVFERGEKSNIEEVAKHIKELSEILDLPYSDEDDKELVEEEKPAIKEEAVEAEVDVEDIPF